MGGYGEPGDTDSRNGERLTARPPLAANAAAFPAHPEGAAVELLPAIPEAVPDP